MRASGVCGRCSALLVISVRAQEAVTIAPTGPQFPDFVFPAPIADGVGEPGRPSA